MGTHVRTWRDNDDTGPCIFVPSCPTVSPCVCPMSLCLHISMCPHIPLCHCTPVSLPFPPRPRVPMSPGVTVSPCPPVSPHPCKSPAACHHRVSLCVPCGQHRHVPIVPPCPYIPMSQACPQVSLHVLHARCHRVPVTSSRRGWTGTSPSSRWTKHWRTAATSSSTLTRWGQRGRGGHGGGGMTEQDGDMIGQGWGQGQDGLGMGT